MLYSCLIFLRFYFSYYINDVIFIVIVIIYHLKVETKIIDLFLEVFGSEQGAKADLHFFVFVKSIYGRNNDAFFS